MIYLDYAGSTPILPELMEHYNLVSQSFWGNPSATHPTGQLAKAELERSRLKLFNILGISRDTHNIIFTASITEANFLALQTFKKTRSGEACEPQTGKILYSNLEHDSVLENIPGDNQKRVVVDSNGFINLEDLQSKITDEINLICIQSVNNEIGTIQQLKEIKAIADEVNLERSKLGIPKLHILSDSAQAPNWIDLKELVKNVDLVTFSSSKIYAPKGVGCLVYKKEINLKSEIRGGHQESGIRAGTENVASISTFTQALELTQINLDKNRVKVGNLRDYLYKKLKQAIPNIQINGFYEENNFSQRAANNLNIFIPNLNTEEVLTALSLENICVSSGSNCRSGAIHNSPLFNEIGKKETGANIRITLGIMTTQKEIEEFVEKLSTVTASLSI